MLFLKNKNAVRHLVYSKQLLGQKFKKHLSLLAKKGENDSPPPLSLFDNASRPYLD